MENSNEVFVRVIDCMRRCKAGEDANEGIVSTIVSSLRYTLIAMIYQLKYVMMGDYNVSNSIAMRQGEECFSILNTNHDKLHCLKSKVIGHLKRFIIYIYETVERLPASKVEQDMIKRTIMSNDLLLWVSSILDSDQTEEDKEVSSGVACSADDCHVMDEEDDADLEMDRCMSRICSNDESSGLKSDEQMSIFRDNDSSQPAPVSEDELTRRKPDELSLEEFSLGELSQFSLCLSKGEPMAIDSASEYFSFDNLPDDLGDYCSGLYSPKTPIDHLNELEECLRDELHATGSLPQPGVSEFIKILLGSSRGEIFRMLTEYQRGLNTATLNGTALLHELLQGSAWLQASTPMLYMGWADFETYDLAQILAINLYRHQKELESKISAFLECDFQFTDIIHFLLFTFACKTYLRRDDELPLQLPDERVDLPLPGEQDLCNHVVVVEAILDEM